MFVPLWVAGNLSFLDNSVMHKFSEWLDAEPGRSADLARHLGYSPSFISNVKAGRKRMPPHWFKHVVEFSNGSISYEDLAPVQPLGTKRRI